MKKFITHFSLLLIVITFSYTTFAEQTQNILVLHSYHQGLEWTDYISKGIQDSLNNVKGAKIYYEYLDTKRNYSDDYYKQLVKLYEEKAQQIQFDMIITSDNAAFNFALNNRDDLYKDIPIIFCGINYFREELIDGYEDIAGIKENADYESTLNLIPKLFPKTKKILVVLDETLTGNSIAKDLTPILNEFNKAEIDLYRNFSMKELQNRILELPKDSAIYILTVNRDKTGQFFTYKEGIEQIKEVSFSPIFGSWDFYLGKGIIGGMITSGYLQGEAAGNIAKEYIKTGIFPDRQILESNNSYIFDKVMLDDFSIKELNLPFGRTIINRPLEKSNRILKATIFVLLSIIVGLRLSLQVKKNNQLRLEEKIEERTQELKVINKKLRLLSQTDELTKLYNRRYVLKVLEHEMKKQLKKKSNLALIMLDIDNFKKINDTFGHGAGDDVLVKVADVLKQHFCEVGRYGGEEFLIISKNKSFDDTINLANKILKEISELKFDFDKSSITLSGGVTMFDNIHNVDLFIKKADDLLYKAKKNGKNRIEI